MTFADLEYILRQEALNYGARGTYEGDFVEELLVRLAQDIRDFIEAEKAEARERSE